MPAQPEAILILGDHKRALGDRVSYALSTKRQLSSVVINVITWLENFLNAT